MKTTLRSSFLVFAALLGSSAIVTQAAHRAFDFKDPKGVNHVQFQLDAPLESITGTANGVSGSVSFDAADPLATKGRIVLAANTLTVGNPMMTDHLRGAQWLDAAQHPEIVFEADRVANVQTQGAQTLADVVGRLTVRGVTREVTVPVAFTYLADKLGARMNDPKLKGDLLVMRATFQINRSDFGIQSGQMTDKVAETIHLSLSIAGASPQA
ncbi:YceI family protein [Opitutus terrae]|uniref:YceI family protein n=1 Tax=Opitutus terrae (strain DSM 11246 / JCM 15787 / PB90-1) TaxID=452637 RepID=B1ZPR3_OPITP|nr:YceI family protein [Opitutus terrae]ACB75516.1 YceI family protein [Opitutus terrae PB90-1]